MRIMFFGKAIVGIVCVVGFWQAGIAQGAGASAEDPVLVKNELVEVRKSDYEAGLSRLPEGMSGKVSNDQRMIIKLLSRLLRDKTLAAQARLEKLDQDPKAKAWLAAETEGLYAKLRIDKIDQDAIRAFEKKEAEYKERAREIYLVNKKTYELPERIEAAHILFDIKRHDKEEGLKLAQEARAKIVAGEDFGKVAREYSEDIGSATNLGDLGWFSYDEMVPEFSKAAFALKNTGDVSEPVFTKFGWHVILFKGKKEAGLMPFEEAEKNIMKEQKQKFIEEYKRKVFSEIDDDPKAIINEKAIDALYISPPDPRKIEQLLKEGEATPQKGR